MGALQAASAESKWSRSCANRKPCFARAAAMRKVAASGAERSRPLKEIAARAQIEFPLLLPTRVGHLFVALMPALRHHAYRTRGHGAPP